jgi:general stress protein 26
MENVVFDRDETFKKQKEYMETRIMQFQQQGNDKLWLETTKEYNKLLGLYESQKIDITSNGKDVIPQVIYLNLPTEDGTDN